MTDLDKHAQFQQKLRVSLEAALVITEWLVRRECNVTIPALRIARTRAEWRLYSDRGDLYVTPMSGRCHRVEVKRRGFNFDGLGDYPYPDLLVCKRRSWDEAVPKPYAVLLVNQTMTRAAIVSGASRRHWRLAPVYDRQFKETQDCFHCPKALVRFINLTEAPR